MAAAELNVFSDHEDEKLPSHALNCVCYSDTSFKVFVENIREVYKSKMYNKFIKLFPMSRPKTKLYDIQSGINTYILISDTPLSEISIENIDKIRTYFVAVPVNSYMEIYTKHMFLLKWASKKYGLNLFDKNARLKKGSDDYVLLAGEIMVKSGNVKHMNFNSGTFMIEKYSTPELESLQKQICLLFLQNSGYKIDDIHYGNQPISLFKMPKIYVYQNSSFITKQMCMSKEEVAFLVHNGINVYIVPDTLCNKLATILYNISNIKAQHIKIYNYTEFMERDDTKEADKKRAQLLINNAKRNIARFEKTIPSDYKTSIMQYLITPDSVDMREFKYLVGGKTKLKIKPKNKTKNKSKNKKRKTKKYINKN